MSMNIRRAAAAAAVLAPLARRLGAFALRWLRNEPKSDNEARAFHHLNGFTEAVMNDVFHRTFQPQPLKVVK